jgi:hypothetical protein
MKPPVRGTWRRRWRLARYPPPGWHAAARTWPAPDQHHRQHPALLRLLYWEGLERGGAAVVDELERAGYYEEKMASIARAQRAGHLTASTGAAEPLYAVIALAGWWAVAPQVTRMLAGASTKRRGRGDATVLSEAAVVTLVRRMSAAD